MHSGHCVFLSSCVAQALLPVRSYLLFFRTIHLSDGDKSGSAPGALASDDPCDFFHGFDFRQPLVDVVAAFTHLERHNERFENAITHSDLFALRIPTDDTRIDTRVTA